MAAQDKSRDTNLSSIAMPSSCMHVGVSTPSTNGLQQKDMCSSGDEHAAKMRKPYTITKQRERWTEEEHKKFLEALKLYGRAWRRIEEHVGTKNAVQIRSHAQKFFTKVVREAAGSSADNVKPIEIPPPRPKRKPMHPYPQKSGHSSNKGMLVLEQKESSASPILSVSEQENRSPTSVLSAVGSDTMGSSVSNLPNHCTSPESSATGLNSVGLLTEQENVCQSPSSSAQEENGSNYQRNEENGSPSPGSATEMKLDSVSQDHAFSKESSLVQAAATSLKLFGRTVLVTDSHKPSSVGGNTLQSNWSSPSNDSGNCQNATEADWQSTAQTLPRNTMDRDFCGVPCKNAWNPWPCGALPLFYCMPFQKELMNSAEATTASLPLWAFYGGLPFPFIHPHSMNLQQNPPESCTESSDHNEMRKEGSWTGSNAASVSEAGTADKNCDIVNSESVQPSDTLSDVNKEPTLVFQLKPSKNSLTSPKSGPENRAKGFVPYKRCLAEKEAQQSQIDDEYREGQRIRLCL